ncbi:Oidioi.mRNA.OKI2018_I69.chr1.g61.t1.cds [Oikopleura dioica]|uniref:Oidioi.mRNA.OKI2018_I69.chr1.g61.t1.cds n=1 Tax=Oikopleura dioica TaxID=34765 RepID=A0ABN7SQX4_OIKDI|nr:Oidioi.mRNA.OKI2018_I69.chr1.g61.t1.cds [Oikopleura dioica]
MKLLFLFVGLSMAGTKCSGDMCWAQEMRGPRPRRTEKSDECSIDAHKTNPESWNMNCPDSCEIMQFLEVVERKINEEWAQVKSK